MRLSPYSGDLTVSTAVDLRALDLYSDGDPHAVWHSLRQQTPVHWHSQPPTGFWSITKWDDANRVLRDHATFTSERGTILSVLGIGDPAAGVQMAVTDPPRHSQLQHPIHGALHGRALEGHEQTIRSIIHDLVTRIPDDTVFDMADVARSLSVSVASALLGLPSADLPLLTQLAFSAVAPSDPLPLSNAAGGGTSALIRAHRELYSYFADLVRARTTKAADDLISLLCRIKLDGAGLTKDGIIANCYGLILGATVTTPQVVTATLLHLIETGLYDEWAANPEHLRSGVEEALRWSSPTNHFMRHATRDVDVRDVRIGAGDAVVVWLGSANRDSDVFEQPFAFDFRRLPNRHIAFGVGAHHCVGHAVARLALRATFGELLGQFAGFAIGGDVRHLRSNFIAGIQTLPLIGRRRQAGPR